MKLIKDRVINLRNLQSIHDFCLAGDYIVIFECSMNLSLWKLLTSACILSPMVIDENLPVLVHVFKKSDFSHLRTIEADPFYIFHFANGCSSE